MVEVASSGGIFHRSDSEGALCARLVSSFPSSRWEDWRLVHLCCFGGAVTRLLEHSRTGPRPRSEVVPAWGLVLYTIDNALPGTCHRTSGPMGRLTAPKARRCGSLHLAASRSSAGAARPVSNKRGKLGGASRAARPLSGAWMRRSRPRCTPRRDRGLHITT